MKNYLKIVRIDESSMKPKYRQVMDAIVYGVETEQISDGDHLPSIHDFCVALEVSKKVIEKAYNELKAMGLISSYQGKGHYINQQKTDNVYDMRLPYTPNNDKVGIYRPLLLEPLLNARNS
jgi:DNA-binding transcriptional regulator YhcF (GntR family)